jgi:hypothetical protein
MPSHIIVIFDHSGSMGEAFSSAQPATGGRIRGFAATHTSKIEEAKSRIVEWIETSTYDRVTVIPFASENDPALEFLLPRDLPLVQGSISRIAATGGTNLASALEVAVEIGSHIPDGWFARHLIVTDGLSDTRVTDLALVARIPADSQGIDALLIDPTPEGQAHLRKLCINGRLIPIYAPSDVRDALAERQEAYSNRALLSERFAEALFRAESLSVKLESAKRSLASPDLAGIASRLVGQLATIAQESSAFLRKIADADFPEDKLREQLSSLQEFCDHVEEFLGKPARFVLSLAHARLLSKSYSSWFLVQVYLPGDRRKARIALHNLFQGQSIETSVRSKLTPGPIVEIQLSSLELDFSGPVKKKVEAGGLEAKFLGKPKEDCRPGSHHAMLALKDATTGQEYESVAFTIRVVDYAFDHVSRPVVAKAVSAATGIGSLATFFLTSLGHIDKGFGLASGTVGGMISMLLFGHTLFKYRTRGVTSVQEPWR